MNASKQTKVNWIVYHSQPITFINNIFRRTALTFRNDGIYTILNRLTKRPLFTNFENSIHNDQSYWRRHLTVIEHNVSASIFRQSHSRLLAAHSDHITPAMDRDYSHILRALYVGSHTLWRADPTQIGYRISVKSLLLLSPFTALLLTAKSLSASNQTFSSAWWYRGLFLNHPEHV